MPKVAKAKYGGELARGINTASRGSRFKKNQRFMYVQGGPKYKAAAKSESKEAEPANTSRYYEGEDRPKRMPSRKPNKQTKLKANYEPGTVLIVLSGRFHAKRVVFLKQLASGLLLVTGPYKVNGVPLRRMNQAYTIATSTKISVDGVDVSKVDDAFFARSGAAGGDDQDAFFAQGGESKSSVSDDRKAMQKKVDAALVKTIAETDLMKSYLNAKFTLTRGQRPHEMIF